MKLNDLLSYNQITIQCHNHPDPDTIGSGYSLYVFFKAHNIPVRLIYSGTHQIKKSNLLMMIQKLDIPLEYIDPEDAKGLKLEGLLITVDCQYGAGNVTPIQADEVAVIDHHPYWGEMKGKVCVNAELGACTTLVWQLLKEARYPVDKDIKLSTALYYGLYTDTNQFSELFNSEDIDMRNSLVADAKIIRLLRTNNLSLQELEIAGNAMNNYYYSYRHGYAVIRTKPCDSNVLGLIADFLMQVGEIDICVVFNEIADGIKYSVRSSTGRVNANELAEYLAASVGTGGGRYEKAGGYISKALYNQKYSAIDAEEFFRISLSEYLESFEMIYSDDYDFPPGKEVRRYKRRNIPTLYIKPEEFLPLDTKVSVSWGKQVFEYEISAGEYWIIDRGGNIQRMKESEFILCYETVEESLPHSYGVNDGLPIIRDWQGIATYLAQDYCMVCRPREYYVVDAMKLTRGVKLFPNGEDNYYTTGMPGDYLVVGLYNKNMKMIESGKYFEDNFEPDEE